MARVVLYATRLRKRLQLVRTEELISVPRFAGPRPSPHGFGTHNCLSPEQKGGEKNRRTRVSSSGADCSFLGATTHGERQLAENVLLLSVTRRLRGFSGLETCVWKGFGRSFMGILGYA